MNRGPSQHAWIVRGAMVLFGHLLFAGVSYPILWGDHGMSEESRSLSIGAILGYVAGFMAAMYAFYFPQND